MSIFLTILFLSLAVYFDLRYTKVPNYLILIFLLFSVIQVYLYGQVDGPQNLHISFYGLFDLGIIILKIILCFFSFLPLFILRVIYAGDIKLFMILSCLFSFQNFLVIVVTSFFMGAIIGLSKIVLGSILKKRGTQANRFHYIHFTIPIFIATLYVVLGASL